jgi:hypothetical protein
MDMRGQLHVLVALNPGRYPEAACTSQTGLFGEDKIFTSAGIGTPGRAARSLTTILTRLYRLQENNFFCGTTSKIEPRRFHC